MPLSFTIKPLDTRLQPALQNKIDQKTKPLGALGQLEPLALKIGLIQRSLSPNLKNPRIVVFAGDHGIAEAGVSAYPQSVTAQMVGNFLAGGAGINVFAQQAGLQLLIVDAGVKADLPAHPNLVAAKIAPGTHCFLTQAAMAEDHCQLAVQAGADIVSNISEQGCNCIGFGEMGIANTSSAAVLMHCLTGIPLQQCVGRGTGLSDAQLLHKRQMLQQALQQHGSDHTPLTLLSLFGGFEIAMMVGAYLKAAESGMVIMVDGFIASAALLVASKLYPALTDYCIYSHASDEQGHKALLDYLGAQPLLNLQLRLGEGTGIALAYPLLQAAVAFLNTMASFEEAGVDGISAPTVHPETSIL